MIRCNSSSESPNDFIIASNVVGNVYSSEFRLIQLLNDRLYISERNNYEYYCEKRDELTDWLTDWSIYCWILDWPKIKEKVGTKSPENTLFSMFAPMLINWKLFLSYSNDLFNCSNEKSNKWKECDLVNPMGEFLFKSCQTEITVTWRGELESHWTCLTRRIKRGKGILVLEEHLPLRNRYKFHSKIRLRNNL